MTESDHRPTANRLLMIAAAIVLACTAYTRRANAETLTAAQARDHIGETPTVTRVLTVATRFAASQPFFRFPASTT